MVFGTTPKALTADIVSEGKVATMEVFEDEELNINVKKNEKTFRDLGSGLMTTEKEKKIIFFSISLQLF